MFRTHAAWAVVAAGLCAATAAVVTSRAERRNGELERDLRLRLQKAEARAKEIERPPAVSVEPAATPEPDVAPAARPVEAPQARPAAKAEPKPLEAWSGLSRPERLLRLKDVFAGQDRKAQLAALARLPELGGPEATEWAMAALQADGPPWLRRKALDVLGELNDPSALPALQKAYEGGDGDLRTRAAVAMARLGFGEPLREVTARAVADLVSPDGGRREDAVALMGRIATRDVLPYLSSALSDVDGRVRKEAVESLGATRLPEAAALLEGALAGADPATREWIQKELRELRGK